MGRPQAQHVVAIAREVIEVGFPKFKVPDRFDIVLRRIARVVVGWGACIQGDIKFNPALFHEGGAFPILNRETEAQEVSYFEAAIHCAGCIRTDNLYLGRFNRPNLKRFG